KRASDLDKNSTGFYSVVFKNIKSDRYVIAYRGSEKYPLEDAYKDFIENDLKIGLGIKPLQFYNGLEVFDKLYDEFKIPKEKISITGHSLGGGIAQFVSIMVDKERGFIPYTCTWNAVGINRDGIINLLDFFNYDKILEKLSLDDIEKQYFLEFKNEYLSFFLKELKKGKVIKDNNTLLITNNTEISPEVDDSFVKNFMKSTKFDNLLGKLSINSKDNLLDNNKVFNALFKIDNLTEELYEADYFIKRIKANKVYEENIVNFCHSEDLTVSLFPHVGAVYQVDKLFLKKEVKKKTIFSNFLFFTKSVQDYHYQDIFLPFIEVEGERIGMFSRNLTIGYLGTVIRKILTLEHCVEKELLADYYSLISINSENFKRI
ncbi:MAG: lipase family protein, partial [Cetobacterium sp.]